MTDCPFCSANWPNLDIIERAMPVGPAGSVAIIRPLNPVIDGHVLVIHRDHDESAAASPDASRRACLLMACAADYVNRNGMQANIITSVGPHATQTVMHTHVHVVPRRPGDGLPLPWTPQQQEQQRCPGSRRPGIDARGRKLTGPGVADELRDMLRGDQ